MIKIILPALLTTLALTAPAHVMPPTLSSGKSRKATLVIGRNDKGR